MDYRYLRELHEHGSQIEATEGQPLTWDRILKFHCLVLYNLPADLEDDPRYHARPAVPARVPGLARSVFQAGGGVLIDVASIQRTEAIEEFFRPYLVPGGEAADGEGGRSS